MPQRPFNPDALTALPLGLHPGGCSCHGHARRALGAGLLALGAGAAWPAWAREGVDVGKQSSFTKLVSADQVERAAQHNYLQMKQRAAQQNGLAPQNHPQVQRLRFIAERLRPHALEWNPRAKQWQWEVNLIGSTQINAFCMPGGKIAFFHGILAILQLSDDEVAMIMGHEMAHALREHARERMGKQLATRGFVEFGTAILGLGGAGRLAADLTGQLASLKFGRDDESEADLVGMELAARAGYDPAAGVSLWQKMAAVNKNAPPQFMSTHPSGPTRIKDIQRSLPKVQPLFQRAPKPPQHFDPPAKPPAAAQTAPARR